MYYKHCNAVYYNVKFAELVHLCSQSPSNARILSTVTFRSVSVLATIFKFLVCEYQDDILQLFMFF